MGPIYNSYLYSSREELGKIVHPLAHPPAFPSSFLKKVGVVAACTPTLPGHPRVLRATLSHRALFPMELQAVLELVSIFDDPARTNKQIKGGRHEFVCRTINDFSCTPRWRIPPKRSSAYKLGMASRKKSPPPRSNHTLGWC